MTEGRIRSIPLMIGALGLLLSACSSTVEWDAITATADDFKSCIASPSSTWLQPGSIVAFDATPDLLGGADELYPDTNAFDLGLEMAPTARASMFADLGIDQVKANTPSVQATVRALAEAAKIAAAVTKHPVHKRMIKLVDEIRAGASPTPVSISLSEATDYAKLVQKAENSDGWEALARSEIWLANHPDLAQRSPEKIAQGIKTAIFIKAYLDAYFRGGRIVDLSLKADAVDQLSKILKPNSDILNQDLVDDLRSELQALFDKAKAGGMFKLGDVAFVSRGGASRQFPGFSATFAPGAGRPQFSEIPVGDVGADIVRVTLEGFFDSFFGLPAVSNATGVGLTKDGQSIGLPDFSKLNESPYKIPFDNDAFERVDKYANSVEGVVRPPLQTALVGISVFGTNNELLSNLVATTVAVSARKAAEYTAWCYEYARAERAGSSSPGSLSVDDEGRRIVDEIGIDLDLGTTRNTVKVVAER